MLEGMALTRPMRSPSQPKISPPQAAPRRKSAVTMPIQCWTNFSSRSPETIRICWRAGRATSGKMPISMPSNIQPRNAASSTIARPPEPVCWAERAEADEGVGSEVVDACMIDRDYVLDRALKQGNEKCLRPELCASTMPVTITAERPGGADAVALITELEAHLEPLYPQKSRHGYGVDKLIKERVSFFVIRDKRTAAGC